MACSFCPKAQDWHDSFLERPIKGKETREEKWVLLFSCAFHQLVIKADVLFPFVCCSFIYIYSSLDQNFKGKGLIGHIQKDITIKLLWGINKSSWEKSIFSNGIPKLKVNQMVKKNTSHLEQTHLSFCKLIICFNTSHLQLENK